MPIRIKPKIDLGPCVLTLGSIKSITELVSKEFPDAVFSATDYVWEIFDERSSETLIQEISNREKLDEFTVSVGSSGYFERATKDEIIEDMRIVFNAEKAEVVCNYHPVKQHWFEHFLIDLKKHILAPTFSQRLTHSRSSDGFLLLAAAIWTGPIPTKGNIGLMEVPYSRIIIKNIPPSPFIENIKANLVSNVIWLVIGAVGILIAQWILRTYGIDLNPFD